MTKIVYNSCFGGFSLSYDAVMEYAKRKGMTLYCGAPDRGTITDYKPRTREDVMAGGLGLYAFFTSPDLNWDSHFQDRDISRSDPDLVAIVEEMGEAADGWAASLAIAEVPAGKKYRIDEYDGNESVMTIDDYEWQTA